MRGGTTEAFRPLDPSDFSFHGFDDHLRKGIDRRISRIGIRGGEPQAPVVEGAVFVPSGAGQVVGQRRTYGGVVTADGQPIETAQLRRKRRTLTAGPVEPVAVAPGREVDEEVVYLGSLYNHFGRVLLESLARVWFLREVDPSVRVVFDYPNAARHTLGAWVHRILGIFGIPASRILDLQAPTRLRRVIVPEPLFEQMCAAHERMIRPFQEVAARVAGDVTSSEQPLYLSRRLLTSRQRPIIGENDLEDVLRDNGFLIAYPETMTIEDQIRLVNGHANIVSSAGSAAHNILFALAQPALHLLSQRDNVSSNFFLCSALAGAPTSVVNCLGTGGRPSFEADRKILRRRSGADNSETAAVGAQGTPLLAELPDLVDYLAGHGLVAKRSLVSPAGNGATLQQRYDEAWFYARIRKAGTMRRKPLPAAVEREAVAMSAGSWPVSLVLARYYASVHRDATRTEAMVTQFVELAAAESDSDRLAHYRADVDGMARRIARTCGPTTADRLAEVVATRFRGGGQDDRGATLDQSA